MRAVGAEATSEATEEQAREGGWVKAEWYTIPYPPAGIVADSSGQLQASFPAEATHRFGLGRNLRCRRYDPLVTTGEKCC